MEDLVYYTNLFDYYSELLTETQKEYFKEYYFENLTLSEIADNNNISRNAISKTIKEVKEKLDYYENKLNLYHNKIEIINNLTKEEYLKIEKYV